MRRFAPSPITSLVDDSPRYNLGESYGRELDIADLLADGDAAVLGAVALSYATSAGGRELRQLLGAKLGVDADEILITTGAVSALFLLGLVLAAEDAEVLLAQPCFPPQRAALDGIGANVVAVRTRFEDGYRLDATELGRHLSTRTSLVAVASPQNPSGVVIDRQQIDTLLDAIAMVCPRAFLLVDETFREAVYGEGPVPASFAP